MDLHVSGSTFGLPDPGLPDPGREGLAALGSLHLVWGLSSLLYLAWALAWLTAIRAAPQHRGALRWWAAHAACSALGLASWAVTVGRFGEWPLLRVLANLMLLVAVLLLRAGIARFAGVRPGWRGSALCLLLALGVTWPQLPAAEWAVPRVAVMCGLITASYLQAAWALWRHLRAELGRALVLFAALPMLVVSVLLLLRAARAMAYPEQLNQAIDLPSALNLGVSVATTTLSTLMQLGLVALLVGRTVAELARQSRHDSLTGLLNRRALQERLDQAPLRQRPGLPPWALLMVDVDQFKRLNDLHGHATGDRALCHLARVLSGSLRCGDSLGRWGGEEFVALLPGTDAAQALALARRLCANVRDAPLPVGPGPTPGLPLSVSIGAATWGEGDDVEALLRRADAALYQAKRQGRDRAVLAGAEGPWLRPAAA